MEARRAALTVAAIALVLAFAYVTVSDVFVIWSYQVGPQRQAGVAAVSHLWNARRTLNLTLAGQEWNLAGDAIDPLNGNPQCAQRKPWDVCRPDYDWDALSASFHSTGDELIRLEASGADSFTRAQAIQNQQKYVDEAVEHVIDAGDYEYGWDAWSAQVAGMAWISLLALAAVVVGARLAAD